MANHNYGEFIEEAIKSILNQDYSNLKLYVVDDNSNDDSAKIIERLADEDFRINPIYLKQGVGAAEARNIALRSCIKESDYILPTDSDDICKINKVSEMVKVLNNSGCGAVYADYDVLNQRTGNLIREFKESYSLKGLHANCIVHSSCMIKKEILESVKEIVDGKDSYYDKELHGWRGDGSFIGSCEDYELFIRISEKTIFAHIPKSLSIVRVHERNQSQIDKVNQVWESNVKRIQHKIQSRYASNLSKA